MCSEPLVSVVIPTKNSESTIDDCLRSIQGQTYTSIETIIVDNYSKDKTKEVAQKYGKVLFKGPERSSQRNSGAKFARGDYLLFIDSDMQLTPSVVDECVRCALEGCDAIIIPEITVGEGLWARVRALERSVYVGDALFECSRFFKKEVFEKLKGYDEGLTGPEDFDLQSNVEEAGYRVGRIASPVLHHEENLRLFPHLRKRLYYSKSLKRYEKKHPDKAKRQLGLQRVSKYRTLIMEKPDLGVLVLFLKGTEYLISRTIKLFY